MTVAWCLLAVALLLATGPQGTARGRRHRAAARSSRGGRGSALAGLAAGVIAAACVAVAGPVIGGGVALVAAPAALAALRAGRSGAGGERTDRALPLYLDLVAAALRAGRPVAESLSVALPAATPATAEGLARVAGLLRLGADPAQAWSAVARDGPLAPVRATAIRSATSGLRLAAAFERLAADVRAELAAVSAARAHRAGVLSMGPLGLCFLPSFVCLGVVPVVVGIARTALGVMP